MIYTTDPYLNPVNWTTEDEWRKMHTHIGPEIGSETIEEIAVSIAAQLVRVRRIKN